MFQNKELKKGKVEMAASGLLPCHVLYLVFPEILTTKPTLGKREVCVTENKLQTKGFYL